LYNTIVSGNLDDFSKTIQHYEREAQILIIYAYELDFYNNSFLNAIDDIRAAYPNGILGCSNDDLDEIQDSCLLQSPFLSKGSRIVGGDFLAFQREQLISVWNMMIETLEVFMEGAYSSEKRIFNRVLNRMNRYTEFKVVSEENEPQDSSTSNAISLGGNTSKIKPEIPFEDLEIFKTETTISELEPKELLSTLKMEIIKRGDDTFKEFVNFLVLSNCIDDSDAVKQLLVYRFTGKCRPKGDLEKIPWNPDKLRELAYIIMYSTVRAYRKYDKVREFFEGPKFPDDISMIRTYADSAPQDFRLGLNNLYPDVFTIKGAR